MLKAIQSNIHQDTVKQEPLQQHNALLLSINTKAVKEQTHASVLAQVVRDGDLHQLVLH